MIHSSQRRAFMQGAGGVLATAAAGLPAPAAASTPKAGAGRGFLREYGFWEYTTPYSGGFESYDHDDYMRALDDMAGAGMNSLMIMVKWFTTGYRSKLPFLDQQPTNKIIASGNKLLRTVMEQARARKIKVWLGAVTNIHDADKYGSTPYTVTKGFLGCPFNVGFYDPDAPEMIERGAKIFEEILDEFPDPAGLMLEMEGVDSRRPYRVAPYNAWAKANNRAANNDLKAVGAADWFDYQTAAIIRATKAIEKAVRAKGFRGDLATINKTNETIDKNRPTPNHNQLVNIEMMHRDCPAWASINYTYDKGFPDRTYDWYMEQAVTYPKSVGMNCYYLSRGVMTYEWKKPRWTDRKQMERSWAADVADVQKFQPQNHWWFGAGGKSEGIDTAISNLKKMGYADDVQARRALLKIAAPLRTSMIKGA